MLSQINLFKRKRGISVIIGYVLLIAVVITISILVYQWLKSYVPQAALACPDGVAITIPNVSYNCSYSSTEQMLNFSLENTGTFAIAGYFIHARNSTSQQIATIDLSPYYNGTTGSTYQGAVLFSNNFNNAGVNVRNPGETFTMTDNGFMIPASFGKLVSIEVTPMRYVQFKSQTRTALCGNAQISQTLTCN